MKNQERAAQVWSVLSLAALNRQLLSYEELGKLTGIAQVGIGTPLGMVQSYCVANGLPLLCVLAVGKHTGVPSPGFATTNDVPAENMRVFAYDWLSMRCPQPEALLAASLTHPSLEPPTSELQS